MDQYKEFEKKASKVLKKLDEDKLKVKAKVLISQLVELLQLEEDKNLKFKYCKLIGDVYLEQENEKKAQRYYDQAIVYSNRISRLFKIHYRLITHYLFSNPFAQILKELFEQIKKYENKLTEKERKLYNDIYIEYKDSLDEIYNKQLDKKPVSFKRIQLIPADQI